MLATSRNHTAKEYNGGDFPISESKRRAGKDALVEIIPEGVQNYVLALNAEAFGSPL